jgi:hypothetical protein
VARPERAAKLILQHPWKTQLLVHPGPLPLPRVGLIGAGTLAMLPFAAAGWLGGALGCAPFPRS